MSRMRIGPALRIEAGCYTERGRVASDTAGQEGSTDGRRLAAVRRVEVHLGGIPSGMATRHRADVTTIPGRR